MTLPDHIARFLQHKPKAAIDLFVHFMNAIHRLGTCPHVPKVYYLYYMDETMFEHQRKSYVEIGEIYFWTATIHNWHKLMEKDVYKDIVIASLEHLSNKGKIEVFAFVIMPNHVHFIWRIKEMNGKEKAHSSFLKYTAHTFKKMLKERRPDSLALFKVDAENKQYEFWQRDSLAVHLYSKEVAFQKLDYIHQNPLVEHWNLVKDPTCYLYSSAKFYETGKKDFDFFKDLRAEF